MPQRDLDAVTTERERRSDDRIRTIARDFAAWPEDTIIVSPDKARRREINKAVRAELQQTGVVSFDEQFRLADLLDLQDRPEELGWRWPASGWLF